MARSQRQRQKWAQGKQGMRAKRTLEREIERDAHFVQHMTQHGTMAVPSRHRAKDHKKATKHDREVATFQGGFKGIVPAIGKEMRGYVPTLRIKDGSAFIRAKAWVKKPSMR